MIHSSQVLASSKYRLERQAKFSRTLVAFFESRKSFLEADEEYGYPSKFVLIFISVFGV